jgi:hypothetical protein
LRFWGVAVPEIARFYGMAVFMYYGDHPPPHLHARYGRSRAAFALADGRRLRGELPSTATRMMQEWILAHQTELADNWQLAAVHRPLEMIPGPDGRE